MADLTKIEQGAIRLVNFRIVAVGCASVFRGKSSMTLQTGIRYRLTRPAVGLGITAFLLAFACSDVRSVSSSEQKNDQLQALIQDLASPQFETRQAAIRELATLAQSAETVPAFARIVREQGNPEVVRRILEVLEQQFRTVPFDSKEAVALADLLEESAGSATWYVSESATDVLNRQWMRRVEVAVAELSRLKVPLQPSDPALLWQSGGAARFGRFQVDPTEDQVLKIYVDEHWPADPRAFELLKRLEPLGSDAFLTRPARVILYRIDGNPLTLEQTALLKGLFGDTRVQDRGRVCLGVVQEPLMEEGRGILISKVEGGSSAAMAGLKGGDLILALNGEELSDFEELVRLLRQFRVGDTVTLKVASGNQRFQRFEVPRPDSPDDADPPKPANGARDVSVKLKGWY